MNKAKIAQSLFSGGDKGAGALFAKKLNQKMEGDYIIHEEMERKRREEEALVAQQEREKRENDLQSAQSLKQGDDDVEAEIKKLSNLSTFEPFKDQVNERDRLTKAINGAQTDDEKSNLMKQLANVDKMVNDNLTADAKQQDAKL